MKLTDRQIYDLSGQTIQLTLTDGTTIVGILDAHIAGIYVVDGRGVREDLIREVQPAH